MIKVGSEIRAKERHGLETQAAFVRSIFVNGRAYSKSQQVEQNKRLQKKYLVKGRIEGGRMYWDVYELSGSSRPKVVGSGFIFQEEAISLARDKSLGRESVAFGSNVRGVFQKGSGGLLLQSRAIETPNQNVVKVQQTSKGVIVG